MTAESFTQRDLSHATFQRVNLRDASFDDVNLAGARIHNVNMADVVIDEAYVKGMTVNGVRIDTLIEAGLDRRDPERRRLCMTHRYDPDSVQSVFEHLATLRAAFCERIRGVPSDPLTRRPGPEIWSAVEHVRHLIFAEDMYLNRWILGNDAPRPKIGLLPSFLAGNPDFAEVGTKPSTDIGLLLSTWSETSTGLWTLVASVTSADLRRDTSAANGGQGTVGSALQVVAQHEQEHVRQAMEAAACAPVGAGDTTGDRL